MTTVVVHPAYRGRGHEANMVKWGMELARTDNVRQGVIAAMLGRDPYSKLGWKDVSKICLEGDEIVPQGLSLDVMDYDPSTD
jgi:hypothetical protein